MARKGIPEKHAPEKTTSPMATQTSPASTVQKTRPGSVRSPDVSYVAGANAMPLIQSSLSQQHRSSGLLAELGGDPSNVDQELQLFFPHDLTTFWQPSETVAETSYTMDLPPWMAGFQQNDPYLDFWPGSQ
jgi:hypothetical protein